MQHKPMIPSQVPTKGDCYEASLENGLNFESVKSLVESHAQSLQPEMRRLYDYVTLQNDVKIVHGWVIPKEGPVANKRVHHAWIEIGKYVVETQGGLTERRDKDEYFKTFTAEVERVYSVSEAEALFKKYGRYGAWNRMELSMR